MEMSDDITYSLKWKNFTSNVTCRLSNVFEENCFTDVTLVSDDQKQFQAHRYVLSNFSPVLENMLLSNPHSHPLIYLRGVHHQVLSSILQFIYLGKTKVNHSNMKRFAEVAKDLQIKKVADNIRMENQSTPRDNPDNNDGIPSENTNTEKDEYA